MVWTSTSTKNPEFSDVKYVEALIGPDTMNTTPVETLGAYRDHGEPKARLEQLEQDVEQTGWILRDCRDPGSTSNRQGDPTENAATDLRGEP
jgi:transaldolase